MKAPAFSFVILEESICQGGDENVMVSANTQKNLIFFDGIKLNAMKTWITYSTV